mmetsp:Transcript_11155/g.33664  ORF Transcript_11155/g.33664 Transcript_11155/m.33664 type:complete len:115 (-) Transcript_11155:1178-1522(-)
MALAHLARGNVLVCKEIAAAKGILVIIRCIEIGHHHAVLTQACLALGALALHPNNKTQIAEVNGINVLIKLLAASQPGITSELKSCQTATDKNHDSRVGESVQEAALVACTNVV